MQRVALYGPKLERVVMSEKQLKVGSEDALASESSELENNGNGPEYGWLTEKFDPGPVWLTVDTGFISFTSDPLKAIRFARREDASRMAELVESEDVRITEHQWL